MQALFRRGLVSFDGIRPPGITLVGPFNVRLRPTFSCVSPIVVIAIGHILDFTSDVVVANGRDNLPDKDAH